MLRNYYTVLDMQEETPVISFIAMIEEYEKSTRKCDLLYWRNQINIAKDSDDPEIIALYKSFTDDYGIYEGSYDLFKDKEFLYEGTYEQEECKDTICEYYMGDSIHKDFKLLFIHSFMDVYPSDDKIREMYERFISIHNIGRFESNITHFNDISSSDESDKSDKSDKSQDTPSDLSILKDLIHQPPTDLTILKNLIRVYWDMGNRFMKRHVGMQIQDLYKRNRYIPEIVRLYKKLGIPETCDIHCEYCEQYN